MDESRKLRQLLLLCLPLLLIGLVLVIIRKDAGPARPETPSPSVSAALSARPASASPRASTTPTLPPVPSFTIPPHTVPPAPSFTPEPTPLPAPTLGSPSASATELVAAARADVELTQMLDDLAGRLSAHYGSALQREDRLADLVSAGVIEQARTYSPNDPAAPRPAARVLVDGAVLDIYVSVFPRGILASQSGLRTHAIDSWTGLHPSVRRIGLAAFRTVGDGVYLIIIGG